MTPEAPTPSASKRVVRLTWERHAAKQLALNSSARSAWDALNARCMALPFMRAQVVAAALEHFGSGQEVLLIGRDGATVMAMVVATPAGPLQWSSFQPSQLPLGAWLVDRQLGLTAVSLDLLKRALPGLPLVMSLTQIDSALHPSAPDSDQQRHDPYIDTSWIDVRGSFDGYWAQRGKNLRQNLRKQRNKLAADNVTVSMHWFTDPAAIEPALARYGQLESQGWKAGQGTAIDTHNPQGAFYQAILGDAATRGDAWVSEYRFDGRTVAMNFGLVGNGTLVVLKTAYDESISKTLSPASLLREDELQRMFDTGAFARVEFFGRTMEWHTKLTASKRAIYHLTTYRWPWVKVLRNRHAKRQTPPAATRVDAPDPAVKDAP
jgi:CelD/BcsL family acetyltransferase involved in cellulose biosynthesis